MVATTLIGIILGLVLIALDEYWLEPLLERRRIERIVRALMLLAPHPRRRTVGPTAAAMGATTTPAGPHPEAARPTTSVGAGRLPQTSAPTATNERWSRS